MTIRRIIVDDVESQVTDSHGNYRVIVRDLLSVHDDHPNTKVYCYVCSGQDPEDSDVQMIWHKGDPVLRFPLQPEHR